MMDSAPITITDDLLYPLIPSHWESDGLMLTVYGKTALGGNVKFSISFESLERFLYETTASSIATMSRSQKEAAVIGFIKKMPLREVMSRFGQGDPEEIVRDAARKAVESEEEPMPEIKEQNPLDLSMETLEAMNTMEKVNLEELEKALQQKGQEQQKQKKEQDGKEKQNNKKSQNQQKPKEKTEQQERKEELEKEKHRKKLEGTSGLSEKLKKLRLMGLGYGILHESISSNGESERQFIEDDFFFGKFSVGAFPEEDQFPPTTIRYRRKIQSTLIDNQFDRFLKGQKRGALDFNSLYKIPLGSERVFQKKSEPKNKSFAFGFLYDASGSMMGKKSIMLMKAIYAIHKIFNRMPGVSLYEGVFNLDLRMLNVPFSPASVYEVVSKYSLQLGINKDAFVSQDDVFSSQSTKPLVEGYYGELEVALPGSVKSQVKHWNSGNNDFICLQRMSQYMEVDKSEKKVLFVLCDGGMDGDDKKRVRELAKENEKKGIMTIGVALDSLEEVAQAYEKHILVENVEELPRLLFEAISNVVKGKRFKPVEIEKEPEIYPVTLKSSFSHGMVFPSSLVGAVVDTA